MLLVYYLRVHRVFYPIRRKIYNMSGGRDKDCYMVGGHKREAPSDGEIESPKRGRDGVVTLAALQEMMKQQTDEIKRQTEDLRKAQQHDLREMAKNLELATKKQIDEIKSEVQSVKQELGGQGEQVREVQAHMHKLEQRLLAVENRSFSSAAASTVGTQPDRSLSVVMGGWPADTKQTTLWGTEREPLTRLALPSIWMVKSLLQV